MELISDVDPNIHPQEYNFYMKEIVYLEWNSSKDVLDFVKKHLSTKIFDYINYCNLALDLDLVDLSNLICTEGDLEYHRDRRMSKDGKRFKEEIERVKKDADRLMDMSIDDGEITIKLPRHRHTILYDLRTYFEAKRKIDDEKIKLILSFWGDEKLPRSGVKESEKMVELNEKYGKKIIEYMKVGHTFAEINEKDMFKDDDIMRKKREASFYTARPKKK